MTGEKRYVPDFAFHLGVPVRIEVSEEHGQVIGRAQYLDAGNTYLVRYRAADGNAVEAWWNESALDFADAR